MSLQAGHNEHCSAAVVAAPRAMATEEKDNKSTDKLLQALDALSQLQQARANRRATSLASSPRSGSGSGSAKDDGDDARAAGAAAGEAAAPPRPRVRRSSSLTSSPSSLSKPPKLEKAEKNGHEEEGADDDDALLTVIIKIQGLSPDEPRPRRRRVSLMLPFRSGSKLDLNLLGSKEFTDKREQGERARQRDMVFPLAAGNARGGGGELVVKLPFHGIDDGEYKTNSNKTLTTKMIRSSEVQKRLIDKATRRKLRKYYISNMLTPKMTRTKTGVPAPDLTVIDSLKLEKPEAEPELNPIAEEVTATQQKEAEVQGDPVDELTPVAEVEEEEQQKEPQSEPADDEPTPVAEVKEELQQNEPQSEPADDEPTPVTEVKEEEQQNEAHSEPADDEPTPVAEVKEGDEQQKEPELEPGDEPTPVAEVKEEDDQQKEPEREPEDAQEDKESELPELDEIDKDVVEEQEVKKAETKDEAEAENGSEEVAGDEAANKVMANGLEEKLSAEATVPSNLLSDAVVVVVDAVKPVNGEVARPEESLPVMLEQGEDKKPPRPRFKWRTVGFLVPMAVLVSNTLGGKR